MFPGEGPRRLISEWQDAVSSGAFEYIDNKNQRKTQGLDKLKGIAMGASLRYNVVPTSIGRLAVYAQVRLQQNHQLNHDRILFQVFPRSLQVLRQLCASFNMDVNSPDIPALSFYPQAAQALSARLTPEDKVCGINTWPLLCYQGQDELAAYPPVHKLDEQVSGGGT